LRRHVYDDMEPWIAWNDIADGVEVEVGGLSLTFSRTDHGPETLAVRVDAAGSSLGYTADTGPGWSVEALGGGLDRVLAEATVPPEMEGTLQHLSARQAGESARAAKAAALTLTHLWPTLDAERARAEGSDAFGAEVEVAAVGRRWEL
jgi:ribonuclease BN (tRNA processing enzyme)